MTSFQHDLEIELPVEVVFAFVTDFRNLPLWNYDILEVQQLTRGKIDLGTCFRQTSKQDHREFEVIHFQSGIYTAIRSLPPAPPLKIIFEFNPTGTHTRLKGSWELEYAHFGLLSWLFSLPLKWVTGKNLQTLKSLLETGEARLLDGRKVAISATEAA